MDALGGLLSFAHKKEIEKQTLPLWLANYAVCKLQGTESTPYSEFIAAIDDAVKAPEINASQQKSGEDILKEFTPIIDGMRGG